MVQVMPLSVAAIHREQLATTADSVQVVETVVDVRRESDIEKKNKP